MNLAVTPTRGEALMTERLNTDLLHLKVRCSIFDASANTLVAA